jgi:hypothetical protein
MLEMPSVSHDDGRTPSYFPRELRSLLHTLDYHAEPLYIGRMIPLCGQGYKWEVHVFSTRSLEVLGSAVFAGCITPLHREPPSW